MSQTKLLLQLVASLEEKELYEVAKAYLTNVDGYKNVIITNSSYDSGIDLKIVDNYEVQYQATVQAKQFEPKLMSDLKKAFDNVNEYGLPTKVKYFYSFPVAEEKVIEYRKFAKDKYGIFLELIEAKVLSQIATNYEEISSLLYSFAKLKVPMQESKFFADSKTKALYDLMSFGKSTDIKYNIMRCFVLNYLFNNKSTVVERDMVLAKLESHFNTTINKDYFNRFLNQLSTEKKIKIIKTSIELTEQEAERIGNVLESYKIEEALLINELSEILKRYGINDNIDVVISKLADIFESNYTSNLGELITRDGHGNSVTAATQRLRQALISFSSEDIKVDELIKELLLATDKNEILSRISAGQAYSKVNDPDRLQQYITRNINNKDIFIDTNVLINLLLVHYADVQTYKDYYYRTASEFLKFSSHYDLHLKTIRKYAIEITEMFKHALSIVPFSKLKVFDSLGGSGNILYKFYTHLKDSDQLDEEVKNFGDFLAEFKFTQNKGDQHFKSSIEYLLSSLNIEIDELAKEYQLGTAIDIINEDLRRNSKHKASHSVLNDALMFRRLADNDSDVNPVDPIFCTWDMSLMGARKMYFEYFENSTRWFMFTPSRLMDHYAMMNFQIRPGTVSNEVLSILSEEHKQMTQSLLMSMSVIINPETDAGLRHSNKIAQLREKEIVEVDAKPEVIHDNPSDATAIDIVLATIVKHYLNKSERLQILKQLFSKNEFVEPIGRYLAVQTDYYNKNNKLKENLIEEIDQILEGSIASK